MRIFYARPGFYRSQLGPVSACTKIYQLMNIKRPIDILYTLSVAESAELRVYYFNSIKFWLQLWPFFKTISFYRF